MSDENHPPTLDEYVDDTLYVNDTTYDNDELYHDDTHDTIPKYDQALIDDIFGLSDDENDFDDVPVQPDVLTSPDTMIETVRDLPDIASPMLRRSGRNDELGKWDRRYVDSMFYNHIRLCKMTFNEGINKLGVTAVDSTTSEFKTNV